MVLHRPVELASFSGKFDDSLLVLGEGFLPGLPTIRELVDQGEPLSK
jgi:hypothetical protein